MTKEDAKKIAGSTISILEVLALQIDPPPDPPTPKGAEFETFAAELDNLRRSIFDRIDNSHHLYD